MKTTLRLFLILLTAFGAASRGRAAASLACPPPLPVQLSELDADDLYYLQGRFDSPAPPAAVFAVLSDYDHLAGVLSGLLSSKVLEREGVSLTVQQKLEGRFLFFRRVLDLVLHVEQEAPWRIAFQEAGAKPFRHYEGAWSLEPSAWGTRVDYTLSVSRRDLAPAPLERKLLRENAQSLLSELQGEVSRRAAASGQSLSNTVSVLPTP
jgi:carbon monoxide dehydrogenase subunit G